LVLSPKTEDQLQLGNLMFKLLSRSDFKEQVFARDKGKCLACDLPAVDAHHILERKLWTDGGYYLENGASLCSNHHLAAEDTSLSCEDIRKLAKISSYPIPEHMFFNQDYDKWGNPILPNGQRLRGELYYNPEVQKILAPVLYKFSDRVKYPRSYHLPWSPGLQNDDRVITDLSRLQNSEIVVTIKMDGENTSLYSDYMHARSLDYEHHPSRSMMKSIHGSLAHEIPKGWRLCGENMFAKHSIEYANLESYFLLFSIWNDQNQCLSWDETKEYASLFGLTTVPEIYRGPWDEKLLKNLHNETYSGDRCEGYVVRLAESFSYSDFRYCLAKFVKKNHVQSSEHWLREQIVPNKLKENK